MALVDWIEALDGLPQWAIEEACRVYLRDQPRRRPTPGDIRQRALTFMARNAPPALPTPEPERERITAARAAEIMAEFGFAPKRIPR